jgi:hypothetical protein
MRHCEVWRLCLRGNEIHVSGNYPRNASIIFCIYRAVISKTHICLPFAKNNSFIYTAHFQLIPTSWLYNTVYTRNRINFNGRIESGCGADTTGTGKVQVAELSKYSG